jgi:hypothetical protein
MNRRLFVAIALIGLCGGCSLFAVDNGPSEAEQRQDAMLKDPMGNHMDPPRSVSDGGVGRDLNDVFFP